MPSVKKKSISHTRVKLTIKIPVLVSKGKRIPVLYIVYSFANKKNIMHLVFVIKKGS